MNGARFWKVTINIRAEQAEQVEDLCDEIVNETVKGFGVTITNYAIEQAGYTINPEPAP